MNDDLEREAALDALEFDALQAERDELSRRLAAAERERDAAWNAAIEAAAKWLSSPGSDGMPVSGILTLKRP